MQTSTGTTHAAHLDLMPVDATGRATTATHVAQQSGDWFDPATWGGEVPGAGALVHIPAGVAVAYDGASSAKLFMIRVDGDLAFTAEDGGATRLVVDTMLTAHGSTLTIEAADATDGTVDIVFAETRADASVRAQYADSRAGDGVLGRSDWDPEQLSLGLVASGEVTVHGQPVEAQVQLATGPAAGATRLVLDSGGLAEGWAAGQQIVIGAADWAGRDDAGAFQSHDEVRTITSVRLVGDKTIVTFDEPLAFDHRGPTDPTTGAELTSYVGNLTRNVTIASAVADKNGDGLADRGTSVGTDPGPDGHLVTERGHVMFMQNDDVSVSHAAFFGLGRTDKSVELDDYVTTVQANGTHRVFEDNGTRGVYDPGVDLAIRTAPEDIENMRGRYALHVHQAGVGGEDDGMMAPCAATGNPVCDCGGYDRDGDGRSDGAYFEGNVVWGSPGWGVVQHDSKADLFNNLTFDINGAAYVAETGNETGTWQGNAAFRTYGEQAHVGNDDADDFNQDFGRDGTAFWLEGRAIDVIDNVAVSSARAAFMYRVNGVGQLDVPTSELGSLGAIAHGADHVASEDVPIRTFEGNRAIGAAEAIRIVTDPLDSVRKFNDAWSHLRDFKGYALDQDGVSITYSSKYIFEDFLLLGTGNGGGGQASAAFHFKASVADITILDSHVERFDSAMRSWNQVGDRQEYRRGYWDPRDPTDDSPGTPAYEGLGDAFGIENPVWNLWNINLVNLTHDDLGGRSPFFAPLIGVELDGRTQFFGSHAVLNTENGITRDDPAGGKLKIELIDDSAAGGLVALWREDLADDPNQARVLAEHIPLAYGEDVYLGQIHFAGGRRVTRTDYLDYAENINNDIWSGTILEFAKTDGLGRHVYAYGDFAPTKPGTITRAVTANERIVWSREQIDGVLRDEGFFTLAGGGAMKFVVMRTVFTDGLTGEMMLKGFLVGLDLAWELPAGTDHLGVFTGAADVIVAAEYHVFRDGVAVPGRAAVVPDLPRMVDPTEAALRPAPAPGPKEPGSISAGPQPEGTPDRDFNLNRATDGAREGVRDDRGFGGEAAVDRDPILRQTGGRDADMLVATAGRDWLLGGRGADKFIFRAHGGNDVVRDFEAGVDTVVIRVAGLGFDDLGLVQSGDDAVVLYGAGHHITLAGIDVDTLGADSFSFL